MTFAQRIRQTLAERGNAVAIRCGDEALTFADLAQSADHWQRFLDALEIPHDARVMSLLPSGTQLVRIHLGNLLSGRISLPFNPRASAAEIAPILINAKPALVVVSAAAEANVREAIRMSGLNCQVLEERFIAAAFAAGERSPQSTAREPDANRAALIVYTSGTTGAPKGVVLSQANLLAGIESIAAAWQLCPDDHLYLALPLFHVHGLGLGIHGMLAIGHRLTLKPKFDADETLSELSRPTDPITVFYGVPTLYHRLVQAAKTVTLLPLRLAVSGSAPLSEALHHQVKERFGLTILERYGMTETLMLAANPLAGPRLPGSVGRPLPGVTLEVIAADEGPVKAGEEGEIRVRGAAVFKGYWRNEEASHAAFDRAGRFCSGDLGIIDPETGYLRISGRRKELIISGGFNIHPREVEEVILKFPGVAECAVVGEPDEDLGEVVVAHVVGTDDFNADALLAFVKPHLSAYKCPRTIHRRTSLPRNAMGKLARHELGPNES